MDNPVNPDTLRDIIRANLCKYTRKAFASIPKPENPRILDIGCGSGVPTIELARLCDCRIVALDNDRYQLSLLEKKVKYKGLEDRIEVINCSAKNMNFPDESFDIIWSEGLIFVIGFEKGLKEWRHILKPGGYMAIHDEKGNVEQKLELITACGYELLDHFILDRDIWWNEYCAPMEREIHNIQNKYPGESNLIGKFGRELREIELFNKEPEKFESVFFVMKKIN